ncbi:PVC-type heme-binding CxxCH protein [Rubritalea marina]|uniref:PVC-type heme-binding CxxCH protein n=1 Tax=Rubritalea marina TaxID=361055 RepID=UPI000374D6FA|nr:PVC-type heme-binding CxxCH protein [Rubritalea marina]
MNKFFSFSLTSSAAALAVASLYTTSCSRSEQASAEPKADVNEQASPAYSITMPEANAPALKIADGAHITLMGDGLASRMAKFGAFETELQVRYPNAKLVIRNMGDEGNTPAFRPHPGREYADQFAFPGAKELARKDLQVNTNPKGHFETPDQWLTKLKTDIVIATFGFSSAFDGADGLDGFKAELDAFLKHTQAQQYNGSSAAQIALVGPAAFEDLSATQGTPAGEEQNENFALYTAAMKEVASANGVLFIDLFDLTQQLIANEKAPITRDGALLNAQGQTLIAPYLADAIFGKADEVAADKRDAILAAVQEKNYLWHNYFKIPNGVHVYGRRFKPYGPQNYPDELKKAGEMTAVRDQAIWAANTGASFDLAAADANTHQLPEVPTNYHPGKEKAGVFGYETGEDAIKGFNVPEGYKVELFASEKEFKNLANPVQISFDNKGRLWVASMPSYPHWKVGDPKPSDTLAIYEDTDGDGKADKETIFAGDLHIPIGFEFAPEGVYVSQSDSLVLLKDTDGDDQYDEKEIIYSGFDDHDTHHAISAFCADPSGAIMMGEGIFLHSNVDTAYGTVRGSNGGFFRYDINKKKLERTSQVRIPNPWGIAFDDYGQDFFLHTSGTELIWMGHNAIKPKYGRNLKTQDLIQDNKVRPTSGLEFVSSSHFPDEVQGDILINNNIGFKGIKQHDVLDDGTGFTAKYRQDLLNSSIQNFRPVDLEFAPDGSLYFIDWTNMLIGHMQHNARDPHRDHVHGRIYRITYPSRPLVTPAKVDGASIDELLENLKLHEYRTRYRTRRELRGRDADEVASATQKWIKGLDASEADYERYLLEAFWVLWGVDRFDNALLETLLKAKEPRVRVGAIKGFRHNLDAVPNAVALLEAAAADQNPRVRLEAANTASWLPDGQGLKAIETARAASEASDAADYAKWVKSPTDAALEDLTGVKAQKAADPEVIAWKKAGKSKKKIAFLKKGREVYHREAHCETCHQKDGKGLPAGGFPPLAGTKWVLEDPERLIKITLKGVMGEIDVAGKTYNGAMTPFEGLLNDEETAAVLTYVRQSFGNDAPEITAEQVKAVRAAEKAHIGLYQAAELLKKHPHQN